MTSSFFPPGYGSGTSLSRAHTDFLDKLETVLDKTEILTPEVSADDVVGNDTPAEVTLVHSLSKSPGETLFELSVSDYSDFRSLAATATLDTETVGTIISGGGTNSILAKTNADGEFKCTLSNPADDTNWLSVSKAISGPNVARNSESITFSS